MPLPPAIRTEALGRTYKISESKKDEHPDAAVMAIENGN
jgi:hypothetical protein